ncbi:hypothetical protein SAMN05877831_102297 [Rhodobacter maris]|uniref:Uncharacterized protein n=1 Tax=Rhodobacter maris TaxID=446682 RepID=A0A285RZZ3_9RHOB|nr:hypothetical protein SAMN05877831_102297 [Rhodobacter maris]
MPARSTNRLRRRSAAVFFGKAKRPELYKYLEYCR